eukprot:m.64569 g.64569  ORF g.64569 m.64569 type:complete len:262 (-) comp49717_c1_seq10:158-943(-)
MSSVATTCSRSVLFFLLFWPSSLENNLLSETDRAMFQGLEKLESLNLAGNQLTMLGAGSFGAMTDLRNLDLRDNYQLALIESGAIPRTLVEQGRIRSDYDIQDSLKTFGDVALTRDPSESSSGFERLYSSSKDIGLPIGISLGGFVVFFCWVCLAVRSRRKAPAPKEADISGVLDWLNRIQKAELIDLFLKAKMTVARLSELDEAGLEAIGIHSQETRLFLLVEIAKFRESEENGQSWALAPLPLTSMNQPQELFRWLVEV